MKWTTIRASFSVASFVLAIGIATFAFLAASHEAFACAACGCGDPTLTTLGAEKPYKNRVRGGFEARYRTDSIGEAGVDRYTLDEERLDLYLAWAPHERVFLQLSVPSLRRAVEDANLAQTTVYGLGDMELRAKFFVLQDRPTMPRHLFSVLAGVKLPTAVRQNDATGKALPIEAQPGSGSVDPIAGAAYAFFPRPWSFFASLYGIMPTRGTSEFRASPTLRSGTSLQYQVTSKFAVRANVDGRFDGKAYENGKTERDSGGAVFFASPEVLVTPQDDLLIFVSFRYPVLNLLSGHHEEGPVLTAGLGYDF